MCCHPPLRSCTFLQDVLMALTFSEVVYRVLDPGGTKQAARVADDLCQAIEELVDAPLRLQWSLPGVGHR